MTSAVVAFGANLGDPARMFKDVANRLGNAPGVSNLEASSLHRTAPVGGPANQPIFFNGAFAVETSLDVAAFFSMMGAIEIEFGRTRKEAWGPRTIDLDLALFGSTVHSSAELSTPHPRMHFRRFVLAPAAEVAPNTVHPLLGISLAELERSLVELTTGETLLAYIGERAAERGRASVAFNERFPEGLFIGLPLGAAPGDAVVHADSIVGIRPSAHFPGVEDRGLERDLDRVWWSLTRGRLWVAAGGGFHPGPHPAGDQIVPAVDLRADDAEQREREFVNFLDGLMPTEV